ncbi:hypothetical protein [Frateuria sp. STR12]|uniref:hypothetical protein n=1 Tax=Frateuria hangzhouensis TaxID=2995589 RepID=UPI002260C91E|nr:hypothetical protein [Frateuria sp. STR12]MCX7512615.1 hypothetical protein [Frateuria sp. STR12]
MKRKTIFVAAGLLLLLGTRSVAWPDVASIASAPAPVLALGNPAHDWVSVRIEWQLGPVPRHWLGLLLETGRELRTWL